MTKIRDWLDKKSKSDKTAQKFLIQGYASLTLLCFLILMLPWFQAKDISFVDQVFFASSIVSTTGLSPANFAQVFNLAGQITSLVFIQLGGIGYMALISFFVLRDPRSIPKLSVKLLKMEFSLPDRYPLLTFIYSVMIFTIVIELVGTIALYYAFQQNDVPQALWHALFHSVSAFCTAGFSTFNNSLERFVDSPGVNSIVLILSLLGSIGFIVLLDFWLKISGQRKRITLTSRIILITTLLICVLGAIGIVINEISTESTWHNVLSVSIFQAISAHTTVGFNNVDMTLISTSSYFLLIIIMVIGASPAGTGGGIKTTSITALFAVLVSILRRKPHIVFLHKEIPSNKVYLATASAILYGAVLILGLWLLTMTDCQVIPFANLLFEAVSALSTVGLSTGITPELSDWGKIIIAILMFIGRLGVLTLGLALTNQAPLVRTKQQIEDIAV